jgi:hypothetical protein
MNARTVVAVLPLLAPAVAAVAAEPRVVRFDLAAHEPRGDKVRGPVQVWLENVNPLRYDLRVGTQATFSHGPDLALPFLPPIPKAKAPSPPPPVTAPVVTTAAVTRTDRFTPLFTLILGDLAAIESDRVETVEKPLAVAADTVSRARDQLEAGVRASDAVLQVAGPEEVLKIVRPLVPVVETATGARWPTEAIVSLAGRLDALAARLAALPVQGAGGTVTWAEWYQGGNKEAYDWAADRVQDLGGLLAALAPDSAAARAFQALQAGLAQWLPVLRGVAGRGTEAFVLKQVVDCSFSFDQTKSVKVELVRRDRLAPPGAPVSRDEVVTVECTSPLSISAGFGFSTIDEVEFGFVQSTRPGTAADGTPTTVVIKRFGLQKRSRFRPVPTLLVNTRFRELSDTIAWHATMGAAVDVKSGETGTDVEFMAGPSVSIKRTLFITAALHVGRVPKLAGGFAAGDEVPASVSAPPIEKEWKPGLVVALTLRLKP